MPLPRAEKKNSLKASEASLSHEARIQNLVTQFRYFTQSTEASKAPMFSGERKPEPQRFPCAQLAAASAFNAFGG
jgi:hypothetical protein